MYQNEIILTVLLKKLLSSFYNTYITWTCQGFNSSFPYESLALSFHTPTLPPKVCFLVWYTLVLLTNNFICPPSVQRGIAVFCSQNYAHFDHLWPKKWENKWCLSPLYENMSFLVQVSRCPVPMVVEAVVDIDVYMEPSLEG